MKFPLSLGTSNFVFSYLLVDSLTKIGVTNFCISPGSRSTPLTLAVHAHPKAKYYPILDERSSAFFALGIIKVTDNPVALICTSGTAGANYYPAVIESFETNHPLIILTADRPNTLRNIETNQTIEQRDLFGNFTNYFNELTGTIPYLDQKDLLTEINGLENIINEIHLKIHNHPGPIHLNIPFSKPLEPSIDIDLIISQIQEYIVAINYPVLISEEENNPTNVNLQLGEKVIILVGPNSFDKEFKLKIVEFANIVGVPILVDPLSGLRGIEDKFILRAYDHYIKFLEENPPHTIIKFGRNFVSSGIERLLSEFTGKLIQFREAFYTKSISTKGEISYFDLVDFSDTMFSPHPKSNEVWVRRLIDVEEMSLDLVIQSIGDQVFEGGFIFKILNKIQTSQVLFVGNSLPVRHLSEFMITPVMRGAIFANRGVSGIDGNISTFSGIASQVNKSPMLIIGDLATLHDLNGLQLIKRNDLKVTIIVINNKGGGIFRRLPISSLEPQFTELFKMEYETNFEAIANLFHMKYYKVEKYDQLEGIRFENLENTQMVEITTDSIIHEDVLRKLRETIQQAVSLN